MTELLHSTEPLVEQHDAVLLDLDGVVYRGAHAVPHAPEAIAALRRRGVNVMYVTNNANRPPATVSDHLTDIGIPTEPHEVTTAAQAAAGLVADEHAPGTRVLVVGGAGLREALTEVGMTVVESADDDPAVVVQGFAPDVGWQQLSEALLAIDRGAEHIASNLDATIPLERGIAIGNGSLVAALVNATGRHPRSTGKPQPAIFHQAAQRAGARRPLVVGDRLDTDLEGARAAGYPGLHVLTGVDGPAELLRCAPARRPSLLALDLRGLLVPHPPVRRDGDRWVCADAVAWVEGAPGEAVVVLRTGDGERRVQGEVVLDLDELRAACAAAWAASDEADLPTALADAGVDISVRTRPEDVGAIA